MEEKNVHGLQVNMNEKGFSILEVTIGLGLLGVITYFSTQGMEQLNKASGRVEADVNSQFLLQQVQEGLSSFSTCREVMATHIPNVNGSVLMASRQSPLALNGFQETLVAKSPQFNSSHPEVQGLNRKLKVHEATLMGNPFVHTQRLGIIFQDDSIAGKTTTSPNHAGKILSGTLALKFRREEKEKKVIDKFHYLPIYLFVDKNGVIQRCTTSLEKFQVLQGSCNALGGLLTYDGCRAIVFESCNRNLMKAQYTACSEALARKKVLAKQEYAPILGSGQSVFCRMEKMIKEERFSSTTDLCP